VINHLIVRPYRFFESAERYVERFVLIGYVGYVTTFVVLTALHSPIRVVFVYTPRHVILEVSSSDVYSPLLKLDSDKHD
jgi:hypothetical protein